MKHPAAISGLVFLAAGLILSPGFSRSSKSDPDPQQQLNAPPPAPQPLTVQQIRGGIYMVKGGSGANTGFFVGEKEVLVIDAKMTEESTRQILAEIAKLTPNPVKTILITHSDGDHVNGLTGFPGGLPVISQEETRRYMDEAFKDEKLRAYLPNKTFTDRWSLAVGKKKIELLHFGPAHTSGDAVVYFPQDKVAFIGDLAFTGRDPLIHRQKNGTSLGLMAVLRRIVDLDADVFIAGHSDPLAKDDIRALLVSIEGSQARVKAMVREGKTLDEIKKAFGVEDAPVQPGRQPRPSFIEVIYLDLTGKKLAEAPAGP